MEDVKGLVRRVGASTIAKLAMLGVLILVMLIPVSNITDLVRERQQRQEDVVREIAVLWGLEQRLQGPVLAVPYRYTTESTETVTVQGNDLDTPSRVRKVRMTDTRLLYALPADVTWHARIEPEIRYRGLFEVVVYEARLTATGTFVLPEVDDADPGQPDWRLGELALGVTDVRGLQGPVNLHWGDGEVGFLPGIGEGRAFGAGIHASLAELPPGEPGDRIPFTFDLVLRGSGDLRFLPAGEETRVEMESPWPTPGFSGAFLPTEREIGPAGFTASWKVPNFGRDYPQTWRDLEIDPGKLAPSTFGVSLVLPADAYQQVERSVKYAVLFIGLTFGTFFLLELLSPERLHAVHYVLVGFALCLFYVLLLALAEHLGFVTAYAIAALATAGLVAAYARSILGGRRWGATVFAGLAALYGYLFVVLRLEDYALLLGAVGLFALLALAMRLTRKLDWYELRFRGSPRRSEPIEESP